MNMERFMENDDTLQTPGPAFVLASLVAHYPDQAFAENVRVLLEDLILVAFGDEDLDASFTALRARLYEILGSEAALDDARSEYIDTFDRGRAANSLYETEYGKDRALVKGNELVDIAAFYKAFGFETGGDGTIAEMIDHVAVELEFYALLTLKFSMLHEAGDAEGMSIVLDARKKFLKSHLGRFAPAICDRPGVAESPYFSSVFSFCRDLVRSECRRLGVEPEPISWVPGQSEAGAMFCGGTVGCVQ